MPNRNKNEWSSFLGNTTFEYGMVGGLLAVCLAGLMLLGPSLNGLFGKVKNDMKLRSGQSDIIASTSGELGAKNGQDSSNLPSQYSIDEDGNAVDASGGAIQVAGSNGERDYGQILRDKKGKPIPVEDLTPEQQQLIKDLANSEHAVARYEEALHRLSIHSGGDPEKFRNSTILVNGTPMKAESLMFMMQFAGFVVNVQNGQVQVSGEIDKGIADYVNDRAGKVNEQVDTVVNAGSETIKDNKSPGKVNDVANSKDTHKNAAETCVAGKYSDSGTACSGSLGGSTAW